MVAKIAAKRPSAAVVLKRPAAGSAAAAVTNADATEETLDVVRADRNKNNFMMKNISRVPEGIVKMLESLSCHQKGKVINNLVKEAPGGGWSFNFTHPFIEDLMCATVTYTHRLSYIFTTIKWFTIG